MQCYIIDLQLLQDFLADECPVVDLVEPGDV
jgi:hypothetical protein